jgi:hypothetical protein
MVAAEHTPVAWDNFEAAHKPLEAAARKLRLAGNMVAGRHFDMVLALVAMDIEAAVDNNQLVIAHSVG